MTDLTRYRVTMVIADVTPMMIVELPTKRDAIAFAKRKAREESFADRWNPNGYTVHATVWPPERTRRGKPIPAADVPDEWYFSYENGKLVATGRG